MNDKSIGFVDIFVDKQRTQLGWHSIAVLVFQRVYDCCRRLSHSSETRLNRSAQNILDIWFELKYVPTESCK